MFILCFSSVRPVTKLKDYYIISLYFVLYFIHVLEIAKIVNNLSIFRAWVQEYLL